MFLVQAHVQDTPAQQELARAQLGWQPWSGSLYPGQASRPVAQGPALAGVSLEVQAQLAGIGLSLVGRREELLYGRISGVQVRAVTGIARQTLELAVQHVQVHSCCPINLDWQVCMCRHTVNVVQLLPVWQCDLSRHTAWEISV